MIEICSDCKKHGRIVTASGTSPEFASKAFAAVLVEMMAAEGTEEAESLRKQIEALSLPATEEEVDPEIDEAISVLNIVNCGDFSEYDSEEGGSERAATDLGGMKIGRPNECVVIVFERISQHISGASNRSGNYAEVTIL